MLHLLENIFFSKKINISENFVSASENCHRSLTSVTRQECAERLWI